MLSICLLIMFITLQHLATLNHTTPNYTSLHLSTLQFLSFTLLYSPIWLNPSTFPIVQFHLTSLKVFLALKLLKVLNREFHLNNDTYKLNACHTESVLHLNYKTSWLLIFMKRIAVYFETLPSIHPFIHGATALSEPWPPSEDASILLTLLVCSIFAFLGPVICPSGRRLPILFLVSKFLWDLSGIH